VAPSPELRERLRASAASAADATGIPLIGPVGSPRYFGFNDGVILPPSRFSPDARSMDVRRAAAQRAPLRGKVRVVVVLAEFSDRPLGQPAGHYEELFFSTSAIATGSVAEYYREVSGGLIDIVGEVVGPYTMPKPLSWYANDNYGIGKPSGEPRANILARDAAKAADPDVDFGPYDNDGNGFVDAFIVVHAGRGGEETGDPGDVWSHKWVLPDEYEADGTTIYAYLTIPEDAKLGVSAHELGHLLFGFPDLYDIDYTSEGIGNWCLMAGGSWNGGGDTPAHPSAWCKANQGWVNVDTVASTRTLSLVNVGESRTVWRLWTDGAPGPEYFLLENRQRAGFDELLPGDGLLVWHIDENQPDNSDEGHYLVALLQADGAQHLEQSANRGDGGDSFPGDSDNRRLAGSTTPSTMTYAGQSSGVSVADISDSGPKMEATVSVSGAEANGEGDMTAQLAKVERRLTRLQRAVVAAAADLTQASPARVSPWSRQSRT
jgi:immune inhibitor A